MVDKEKAFWRKQFEVHNRAEYDELNATRYTNMLFGPERELTVDRPMIEAFLERVIHDVAEDLY